MAAMRPDRPVSQAARFQELGMSGRAFATARHDRGAPVKAGDRPANRFPPTTSLLVCLAIDSSPAPTPRCCGGRGIVRPTASACARRRQGASRRSAPASRGSRPGRRLRARLSRPGIYRTMPNPDPLHLVVDDLSRLTHFRATVDSKETVAAPRGLSGLRPELEGDMPPSIEMRRRAQQIQTPAAAGLWCGCCRPRGGFRRGAGHAPPADRARGWARARSPGAASHRR